MEGDWNGPIDDPDVRKRLDQALEHMDDGGTGFLLILCHHEWPERTIGVFDGKPTISEDLIPEFKDCVVIPENN